MPRFPRIKAVLFAIAASLVAGDAPAQSMSDYVRERAEQVGGDIASWYRARNHQPVWSGQHLGGLADFIRSLDNHGLSPSLFQLEQWDAQWRSPSSDPRARAEVEVGTTQLALYAIQSLAYGYVDPTDVHPKWADISRQVSAYHFLEQALQEPPNRFATFLLERVPPQNKRYEEMVSALARYREISSLGGWKDLPSTARPAGPGSEYPELRLLASRLQAEGDLPPGSEIKRRQKEISQRMGDAIKSFQFRHGIEPDGYLGPNTLHELNTAANERVHSLIINIDRLRWMPRAYEQTEHIEVNIAEGALRMFENDNQVTVMPVIVGVKGKHQTPVFHGNIEHLFFRPYWNIPLSIAKSEIVPDALNSPDPARYMAEHNYEIVESYGAAPSQTLPITVQNIQRAASGSLLLRQSSGPNNSLGLVKFIFPNDSSVYLHDTPERHLFDRTDRDFSHGCVRVARPDELATLLLRRNGGWNINSVQAAMQDAGNPSRKENLASPMPVYLIYWTSTVMRDGRVRFDQDIYRHDRVMLEKFGLPTPQSTRPVHQPIAPRPVEQQQ